MNWGQIIGLGFSALLVFAALAPRIPYRAWWTRSWVYGRQQLLVISAAILAVYLITVWQGTIADWVVLAAIVLSGVVFLLDILPYASWFPESSPSAGEMPGTDVQVLLINVLQDSEAYQAVSDRIVESKADIVFLCETNNRWEKGVSAATEQYDHRYERPLEDYNGLLFYSKFEIVDVEERYVSQDYIPSLKVTLKVPQSGQIRVYAIHPRPPRPEDPVRYLDNEIEQTASEADRDKLPCLIMGDLNEVGWSPLIRNVLKRYQLFDPRQGRGLYNTYNAKWPFIRWPLDHVFHTKPFRTAGLNRLASCGSDHFPLLVSLKLASCADSSTEDPLG